MAGIAPGMLEQETNAAMMFIKEEVSSEIEAFCCIYSFAHLFALSDEVRGFPVVPYRYR